MWLLLIVCSLCSAMQVIEHSNHGAMHMENVVRPESTWLIVARNDQTHIDSEEDVAYLLTTIKEHLKTDECMLHLSKHSPRLIILVIHCPLNIMYSGGDDKLEVPSLVSTVPYLYNLFGRASVMIERNNVVSVSPGAGNAQPTVRRQREEEGRKRLHSNEAVQIDAAWHLDRIDRRFLPLSGEYMYASDGEDVDVYVLDTGIRTTHEQFQGRAVFLYNAVRDNVDTDCNGHGTHVAGIVGSHHYGVAKKAQLFSVKVLGCDGEGTIDGILEGADVIMNTASQRAGRRGVINLSLGGDKSAVIDNMVAALKASGLVVVLAAGNSGKDACDFSPSGAGRNNNVLTVGASDIADKRPQWSNHGKCVSITAPGAAITSTWFTSDTSINTISGTSMAAPVVTGVAAMILQQNNALSVAEVNAMIVQWATPGVVDGASNQGGGSSLLYSLINASRASTGRPTRPVVTNPPVRRSPGRPALTNPAHSGARENSVATSILCVSFTLLWFLCML